ncbi:MAG TPA: SPOR domain-containing protein [Candidatus Acidoferrales bacterium]
MAGNGKRGGGGDRVLESRHLVGLFLGVVLLCGVFFTLGYVMGRTQFGGAVKADSGSAKTFGPAAVPAKSAAKETPEAASKPAPDGGWDFYPSSGKAANNHLEPAVPAAAPAKSSAPAVPVSSKKNANSPPAAATKPAVAVKEPARFQAPALGKNSIVLQVAATKQQRDALDMADILQKKKFPSFVASSPADTFYHVQVGPYPDLASAEAAKRALEQLGFKSIIKR